MGAEDTAFGAILEIPQTALDKIEKADKDIRQLAVTSLNVANSIKTHWEKIATSGLDVFLSKVNAAKDALSTAGDISLNLKINENNITALSQSAATISEIAQRMSQLAPTTEQVATGMSKVSAQIKDAFPYEAGKNIDQLTSAIKKINDQLVNSKGGVPRREDEQYLVNLRDRYQQELNILNQSSRQKDEIAAKNEKREQKEIEAGERRIKAQEQRFAREEAAAKRAAAAYEQWWGKATLAQDAKTQTRQASEERSALAEQNRLLNERLKIQKQLSNLSIAEQKNTILGKEPLTADQMGLRSDLLTRISQIDTSLTALGAKYDTLSEKSRQAWDTRNAQSYIAWQQETIRYEEKLNQERIKANEIIANQAKGKLQPTTEELSVQRQLNSLYTQKLNIEKEIQQVNNQIAISGQTANSAQQQYLSYLTSQTRALDTEIAKVGQGYSKIAASAQDKYLQDWLRAQEKAAYDLAQAQERVNKARQSEDIATKLAQYKALVAENEKLTASMRAYIKSAGQAPAPTDTSAGAAAYRDMERQWQENENKRRNLSAQNIAEIVEYERQMRLKANQQAVSDFIQMQAQMTAEAKRAAQEQSTARQQAYQKYITSYEGAMRAAAKLSTGRQTGDYADTYENRARAIDRLEKALKNLSKTDVRYEQKVAILIQKLNELRDKQEAVNNSLKRQPKQLTFVDAQRLRDIANAVQSLHSYEKAYKAAIDVMSRTQYGSKAWSEMNGYAQELKKRIDEIKKSMGELKSETQTASNNFSKLKNYVAAAFSVAAITGYIKKMVEVRAQFEMQQVALRAILQNKDEADRIFMQVQQMALQSPFSILQLTTYTKQLAAYRIEANKLVGTTKMLADVSAGLGVDIQRLILAYGQVKSANYLRACLGKGTPIMMFDGTYKNVEDVAVGDMLMGDDERPRFVSRLYQGEQMMYCVRYDGGEYRCNEHHILTAYDALTMRVVDVRVLDYLKEQHRYQGVRRVNGQFKTFPMKIERDVVDTYYGFSIDSNRRFIIKDNIVTHNTEIRQFTEAGLNIAGELSNYFSELQGRMVSVGEVMDMVTKRMVRFEDVEEVFKRVTSAGGLFYDMQRKQSETIAGQMQRIGDAYSIMLNEIGISNQSTITSVLDGIRNLISSWREMLPLIKSVGAALVAGFGIKYLIIFGVQLKNIVTTMAALRALAVSGAISLKAMSVPAIASGIGAIAAAVALLGTAIYECVTHTTKLREEFDRMQSESFTDMLHSVSRFKELADIIRDNTLSVQQHTEAMEEMKRTYSGILPTEQLEIDNIRAMKDGYEDATAAIRAYYAEQLNKKAQEARNQAIMDEFNELSKTLRGASKEFIEQNTFLSGVDESTLRADINKIVNTIAAEVAAGSLKIEDSKAEFAKRLTKFYGAEAADLVMPDVTSWVSVGWDMGKAVVTGISGAFTGNGAEFRKSMNTLRDDINFSVVSPLSMIVSTADRNTEYAFDRLQYGMGGIVNEWGNIEAAMDDAQSHEARLQRQGAQGWIEYYDVLHKAANYYFEKLKALYAMKGKGELYGEDGKLTTQGAALMKETEKSLNNVNAISEKYGLAQLSVDNITNALVNQRNLQREIADSSDAILGAYLDLPAAQKAAADEQVHFYNPLFASKQTIGDMVNLQRELADGTVKLQGIQNNTYAEAWGQRAKANLTSLTQVQQDVYNLMDDIEAKAGKSVLAFDKFNVTAQAGISEVRAEAKKLYEQQEELIKQYDAAFNAAKNLSDNPAINAEIVTGLSEEEYATMQEQLPLIKLFAEALGNIFKAAKGGRDTDPWQKRVSLIKEMNTEYEKLLKYYDEELAKQKIQESYAQAVAEAFEGVIANGRDLSDIKVWYGFDKKGMIKELQNILQSGLTLKPNKRAELNKMLAGLKAEVDIEFEVKSKEEMQKKIDELFADYNLGEEFAKLGLPKELTAMFGRDTYKDLEAVKAELEKIKSIYTKDGGWGQIDEDAYQAALKKLNQIDRKNQEERAKNYYKYLLETYSKGAQIRLKAQQEVNKIMASEQYDEWTKRTAEQNIMLKAQADQQKLALQQFQSSDLYVDVFADLKSASEESLQYVINKLREFKDSFADMPADQVRAIIKQIESAETALSEKNLFGDFSKNVKDMIAYFKTRKQLETQLRDETTKQAKLRENINKKNITLGKETTKLKTLREGTKEYEDQERIIRSLQDEANSLNDQLKESEERAAGFAKSLASGQRATNNVRGALKGTRDAMGAATTAIGGVFDGLDSMGLVSDGMRDVFDSLQGVMAGLDTTIAGIESIDVTKPMTIITGIAQAIGGVFQTIGGFFGMTDKKKERQINRLRDKVEDLDRAYQKLENTMERVYAFEDYVYGSKQLERNLRQQLNSYEQMLELEKSKKKSDTATIREFEDAIEDLKTQLQDLADERTQALGGIGKNEWAEAAEDFMDVWFDAFKEQGDGLDALNDKWDEYLKNLIVKQSTMRIVSKRLSGLFDMVDRAVSATSDQGEKLTRAELDELNKKRLEVMAALNGELKDLMEAWGIAGGQGELLLSDLQKGITNITEAQAAAIEAYLNSIRFAVYEHTNQLNQMLELLRAQYGASADSPILAEIRNIKSILTTISNNLSSVIKYDNGNYKVRVG